ncbi:MAG: hypothetical protein ACK5TO_07630 [Planctomycetaceae bacterium]
MSGGPSTKPGEHIGRPYRSIDSQPLDVHDATYVEREADAELWRVIETGGLAFIQAPRRVGKTSLLLHGEQRAAARGELLFVSLDLQGLLPGMRSPSQLFEDLWEAVTEALEAAQAGPPALGAEQERNADHGAHNLQEARLERNDPSEGGGWAGAPEGGLERRRPVAWFASQLQCRIAQLAPRRLVLAFDEIERCGPAGLPLLLDALRLLFSQRGPARDCRTAVVLVGSASPATLCGDQWGGSPFNLGTRIAVRSLRVDEVARLLAVMGCVPAAARDGVARRIVEWTGGSAFLANAFARVVSHRVSEQGGPAEVAVDELAETILSVDPHRDSQAGTIFENALAPLVTRVARLSQQACAPGVGWLLRQAQRRAGGGRWSSPAWLASPAPPVDQVQLARDELVVAGVLRDDASLGASFSSLLYQQAFSKEWVERHFPEPVPAWRERLVRGLVTHARRVALALLGLICLVSLALWGQQRRLASREHALRMTTAKSSLGSFRLLQQAMNDPALLTSPRRVEWLSQAWHEFEAFPLTEIGDPGLLAEAAESLREFTVAIGDASLAGQRTTVGTVIPDAVEVAEREVMVAKRLLQLAPDHPAWKELLAGALRRKARLQGDRGDSGGAVQTARQSVALADQWRAEHPDERAAHLAHFSCQVEVGAALFGQGMAGEASLGRRHESFTEAQRILEGLAESEEHLGTGDPQARLMIARRYQFLAILWHKMGDRPATEVWSAADRVEDLLSGWPEPPVGDFSNLGDWLLSQQVLSRALNAKGLSLVIRNTSTGLPPEERWRRGVAAHERALAIRKKIWERCPWLWSARRDVGQSLGNLAEGCVLLGDIPREIHCRRQVWELLREDVVAQPQLQSLVNLWRLQGVRLSMRLLEQGQQAEAATIFADALTRVPTPLEDAERYNLGHLIQVLRGYNLLSQQPDGPARPNLPDCGELQQRCLDLFDELTTQSDRFAPSTWDLVRELVEELAEGILLHHPRVPELRRWCGEGLAALGKPAAAERSPSP